LEGIIERYCQFTKSEFNGYVNGVYMFTDKYGDEILLSQSALRQIVRSF
jgi:hypothetical protein